MLDREEQGRIVEPELAIVASLHYSKEPRLILGIPIVLFWANGIVDYERLVALSLEAGCLDFTKRYSNCLKKQDALQKKWNLILNVSYQTFRHKFQKYLGKSISEVRRMLTIRGIYDGKKIEPLEEIPFKEKKNVIITFLEEPVEEIDLESEIDPIKALRGCAKGSNLTEKLLESRREDLELEEAKWKRI